MSLFSYTLMYVCVGTAANTHTHTLSLSLEEEEEEEEELMLLPVLQFVLHEYFLNVKCVWCSMCCCHRINIV